MPDYLWECEWWNTEHDEDDPCGLKIPRQFIPFGQWRWGGTHQRFLIVEKFSAVLAFDCLGADVFGTERTRFQLVRGTGADLCIQWRGGLCRVKRYGEGDMLFQAIE